MNQLVSVKDACQFLGVSASTFKRYCDKHAIPLIRTVGGHRRIDRADLDLAFGFMWSQSHRKPTLSNICSPEIAIEMVDLLLEGDIVGVTSAIFAQVNKLCELSNILESTLIAALWRVGELWRTQEIDIYQERICSNTACTVLDTILQRLPNLDGQSYLAIGGTFESNFDTIGSKMVSLVLRSIGVRTIDLGCNLPAASIAKAACELNASVVWICHTHVFNTESILANHQLLRQLLPSSVRIMIGGGGLSPAIRRSLCDCMHFESLSVMSETMKHSI